MWTDSTFKAANWLNRWAIRLTGGRLGWKHKGIPIIEITTTGRRSGEPRTTLLSAVAERDGAPVLIASRGGTPKHPAWFLNLQADPTVTVRDRRSTRQLRARVAEGEERAALWNEVTAQTDHYAKFQARTDRVFPIVILEPAEAAG